MALKTYHFSGFTGENSRLEPELIKPTELSLTRNVRVNKGVVESSEGVNGDAGYRIAHPFSVCSAGLNTRIYGAGTWGNPEAAHPAMQDGAVYEGVMEMQLGWPGWNPWYLKPVNVAALTKGSLVTVLLKCWKTYSATNDFGRITAGVYADNGSNAPNMAAPLSDHIVSWSGRTARDIEVNGKSTFRAFYTALTQDIPAGTKVWVGFSLLSPGILTNYLQLQVDFHAGAITDAAQWKDHEGNTNIWPVVSGYRRTPVYGIVFSQQLYGGQVTNVQPLNLETQYTKGSYFTELDFRFLNDSDAFDPNMGYQKSDMNPSPMPTEIITGPYGVSSWNYQNAFALSSVELSQLVAGQWLSNEFKAYPHTNIAFFPIGSSDNTLVALVAPSCPSVVPLTILYLPRDKARAHVFQDKLVFNDWGDKVVFPKKPTYIELTNLGLVRRMTAGYAPISPTGLTSPLIWSHQYAKFIWTQHDSLYFGGMTWYTSKVNFSEPAQFDVGDAGNTEGVFAGEPITAVLNVSPTETWISSPSKVIRFAGTFGTVMKYPFLSSGCPNDACMTEDMFGQAVLTRSGVWLVRQGVQQLLIDMTNQTLDFEHAEDSAFIIFDELNMELVFKAGVSPVRYNIIDGSMTKVDSYSDWNQSHPQQIWAGNFKVLNAYELMNYGACTYKVVEVATGFLDVDQSDQEKYFERVELEFKAGSPQLTAYSIVTDNGDGYNTVSSGAIYDSAGAGLWTVTIPVGARGKRIKIYFKVDPTTDRVRWIGGKIRYSLTAPNTNR